MTEQTPAVFDRTGRWIGLDDATIAAFDPEEAAIYHDLAAAAKFLGEAEAAVTRAQGEVTEATKALRTAQEHVDTKVRLTHDDLVRTDLIHDPVAVRRVMAQGKI